MPTVTASDTIDGVWIVEPSIHGDQRGLFIETYRREWFPNGREMVQGNRANRQAGAVVGLHYHLHLADYWYVPFGHARVVPQHAELVGGVVVPVDQIGDHHVGHRGKPVGNTGRDEHSH
ncbi:MAG: dTDP-4-dehydrorhamnose 3,5-epimerase, partial [Ilumatobacteraceae bacterium]